MPQKSYQVTLQPSGHTFKVNENEFILDAALRQGIGLPYGCRSGSCGTCLGTVVSGEIDYPEGLPLTVMEHEHQQGKAVFCVSVAKSDLILDVKELAGSDEIEIKMLPARVASLKKLSSDVMQMLLKLPENERLAFHAGQYIEFILRDRSRRAFSLANAPTHDDFLELHLRLVKGGKFTEHVFNEMKEKAIVRFEGPFGQFQISDKSNRPLLLIAGGTGFAPIKAMIEQLIESQDTRPVYLYWGVRSEADLYLDELAKSWEAQGAIQYIPVLSEAHDTDWQGKTGFVHEAVIDDLANSDLANKGTKLSDFDVYAAGPPPMIEAIKDGFKKQGLPEEQLFFDSFEYADKS